MFATAATVLALGISSVIQPLAKRLQSAGSARGLATGVGVLAAGIALTAVAVSAQSVAIGLGANAVIGAGMGITMVCGLLEVQRIATAADLASLIGVFYALAYAGFLVPTVIAAVASWVAPATALWVLVGLAVLSVTLILRASGSYLPASAEPAGKTVSR
jgi:hypothetical protein